MLYGLFRIIFGGIVFTISLLVLKRTRFFNKKIVFLTLILYAIIISVFALFPVENLFISFKTPENVLNYYSISKGKVDDIIYGSDSCMLIYSEGSNVGGYFIIPKSKSGYKIPSFMSVSRILRDRHFTVYNIVGTNDYYVYGVAVSEDDEINIIDSNDNEVKSIITQIKNTSTKIIWTYSFVENFTTEYYILINGEKIMVAD